MSGLGKFYKAIDTRAKKVNPAVVSIGEVKSLSPFSIIYNGVEISAQYGDAIYLNNLLLDENINLDKATLSNPQNVTEIDPALRKFNGETTSFTGKISGTQLTFLTDFYDWAKAVHDRYILHIGDLIAIQKLGNNTYIVLQKLQKVTNEQ